MPELESEESAEQRRNQPGKGRKILTPNQMLSLAQLQSGNNSQKLKNEIRQLLYCLYRSKHITKQVCNNLINNISIKQNLRILNLITVHKILV